MVVTFIYMDETMGTLTITMGTKPLNYEANQFLGKVVKFCE